MTICPVCGTKCERGRRHDCPGPVIIWQGSVAGPRTATLNPEGELL